MSALALTTLLLTAAQAAPSDSWNRLHYDRAEASSFLRSNWNKYNENYHPNYVGDDNPATAWVEGVDGQGEGETLLLPVSALASARAVKLRVRNGYQKSAGLLAANSAPKEVRVAALAGGREVAATTAVLERELGWQELSLAIPAGAGFSAVSLQVLSVHPGSRFADTCISDVQVWVDTDVPYRQPVELARQKRLDAWIQERVKTAQWFASQPTELPFAATAYSSDTQDLDPSKARADVQAATAQLERVLQAGQLSRRARKTQLEATPDGLWSLAAVQDLLVPGNVSWFQTDDALALHRKEGSKEEGWYVLETRSHDRVLWRGEDRRVPEAIAWTERNEGEERGPYANDTDWMIAFGPDGKATQLVRRIRSKDEMGSMVTTSVSQFSWKGPKIDTIDTLEFRDWTSPNFEVSDEQRLVATQTQYRPAP